MDIAYNAVEERGNNPLRGPSVGQGTALTVLVAALQSPLLGNCIRLALFTPLVGAVRRRFLALRPLVGQQLVRYQPVAKEIGLKLQLQPVLGLQPPRRAHDAGVADQDVQRLAAGDEGVAEAPHL